MTHLESVLQASVNYNAERERQERDLWLHLNCVKPTVTDEELAACHARLLVWATPPGRPLPMPTVAGGDLEDDATMPCMGAGEML